MAKSNFDVNTTTKLLETTKQFVGGLKTVDTDDSLGSFFLRDVENICLSEYGFLEKRYGLVDDNDLDWSAVQSTLTHPYPNFRVQGYFEYTRRDGFYDQILFANGRLYLARPDNDIDDNPEVIDGRFHQVTRFSKKDRLPNISDELFNNYIAEFILDPTKQTQVQTRTDFDDLFYGVDEIEAVRIGQVLYLFTGVYPLIYDGDGKFYLLPEYVPSFSELKINSHNIHNANNAEYYSQAAARETLKEGKFLASFQPNVVFEYLDEAVYPRLPYTNREGTIFTVEVAYQLHESLLPSVNFSGFLDGSNVPKLESQGGIFAEIIPKVYYRPSGAGASNLEWIEIDKESLIYTRRTNFDDEDFTATTFNTLQTSTTIGTDNETIDYYTVDFKLDDTRAINQSIRSTGPYKVEIQNMPSGDYDVRVDLILQTAGYEDLGSSTKVFSRKVISALSREYLDIIFTEDKLEDYLFIDPAGLWTCNRVLNHYGKLMAYGSRINPQTVYIGHPKTIEYFPDFFTLDFETDDEQEIQKITPWMNILVVQSQSFTWGLTGVQSLSFVDNSYTPFAINPIYGTIAPKSVRPVRNQLYFLSREGLVSLNSLFANDNQYNIRKIDMNIENIVPLDPEAVAIQYDNQYWIHFPNSKDNMTLRYYIDNKSWMKDTYFEYNGLDTVNKPKASSVVFNGLHKYIRKDGDLFMITNLMRLEPTGNLTILKVRIDESLPTDLGEAPRSLFETAYMNQGFPFHPKKYLEQRFDFTIQNEFNFARNGELYRELSVDTLNQIYNLTDLLDLKPNHSYRVQVDAVNPLIIGQTIDPVTGTLLPVFLPINYGIAVNIKKDGVVIASEIAPLSKTADPIIFQDFSSSNNIFFKILNNDDDNADIYYDLDLVTRGLNPAVKESYRNVVQDVGSRNITDELMLTVDNLSDGSIHRVYVLAASRDDFPSNFLEESYTLSSVSLPPILNPVLETDITNTTITISWVDQNLPASSKFRIRWVNLDTGVAIASDGNVSGTSYLITGLVAGNDYRIYIQAEFEGRFSPEVYVDVETTTGLLRPQITNITGTTTATVFYTDPNQEQEETAVFLQFQKDNLFIDNVTPTPIQQPANSTSAVVTIPNANTIFKFRVRAFDGVTNEFSFYSDFRQYVFAPIPDPLSVSSRGFTSLQIAYPNYDTVTEYQFRYKPQSLPDIEENWTEVVKTYSQATTDNYILNITGLQEAVTYDVQYRLRFVVNTFDLLSAGYRNLGATTDSSIPFTSDPTVTTFANTFNSITLRVTNTDPVPVTVFANLGNVNPTTSRGTINTQNGTLNVLFGNLPTPLTSYEFSVATRATDNSKLKSATVLHTASTTATTTTTTTTTAAPTSPPATTTTTAAPTAPPPPPPSGPTYTGYYCSGTNVIETYSDGSIINQGQIDGLCGYSAAPPPSPSPSAPTRPSSLNALGGSNDASLSWTASSGATSYNWRIGGTSFSGSTSGTSVYVSGVPAGTYFAYVSASNSVGTSSERSSGSFTVTGFA